MLRMVSGRQSPLRKLGPQPREATRRRAREQQIVLAVHDALGPAGGATGVGDSRRSMGIGVDARGRGRRRTQPAPVVGGDDGRPRQLALRACQDCRGLAIGCQQALLVFGECFADSHPDGADALRSVKCADDVQIIGQAGRHPVAGTNALRPQHGGGGVGRRVELAIGQRSGLRDDGRRIRSSDQRLIEDARDSRRHEWPSGDAHANLVRSPTTARTSGLSLSLFYHCEDSDEKSAGAARLGVRRRMWRGRVAQRVAAGN